jgi:hypothetical protein
VSNRRAFLVRIDPAVLDAIQRWAADDLRSVNGQIEFVLRDALQRAGRFPSVTDRPGGAGSESRPQHDTSGKE